VATFSIYNVLEDGLSKMSSVQPVEVKLYSKMKGFRDPVSQTKDCSKDSREEMPDSCRDKERSWEEGDSKPIRRVILNQRLFSQSRQRKRRSRTSRILWNRD
jgi:hypothetical protein